MKQFTSRDSLLHGRHTEVSDLTIADQMIGGLAETLAVLSFLPASITSEIRRLQLRLLDEFGDAVYVNPTDTLHVTLFEVMGVQCLHNATSPILSTEEHKILIKACSQSIGSSTPVELLFNHVLASEKAIILLADDPSELNSMREQICSILGKTLPYKAPPQIAHCTIARFNQAIPLSVVNEFLRPISIRAKYSMREYQLVNGHRVPLLRYDVLDRFVADLSNTGYQLAV